MILLRPTTTLVVFPIIVECLRYSVAFPLATRSFHRRNHQTRRYGAEANAQQEGQANRRLQRHVKREDRVAFLQESGGLSETEEKELKGLMSTNFSEQYSSEGFTDEHMTFKATHNHVFLKLSMYCQAMHDSNINLFYLDGPCGGTTKALLPTFDLQQCYTANRHESTCQALLADQGLVNVEHASAAEALNGGAFSDLDFHACYFDGCGGYAPIVSDMIEAALTDRPNLEPPIAVGFSILGGGRDCVDKEQEIIRLLVQLVKPMGFRVDHVGDDPARYGIDGSIKKVESSTLTTWCMIEKI